MKPLIALCVFGASLTGAFWAGRRTAPAPIARVEYSRPCLEGATTTMEPIASKPVGRFDLRDFGVKYGTNENHQVWNALQSASSAEDKVVCAPARIWARIINRAADTGESNPNLPWEFREGDKKSRCHGMVKLCGADDDPMKYR